MRFLAALLILAACGGEAPQPEAGQPSPSTAAAPPAPAPPPAQAPARWRDIVYAEPAALGRAVPARPPVDLGAAWSVRRLGRPAGGGASPEAARLLRIFPRTGREAGIVIDIALHGTLVLKDGCIRIAGGRGTGSGGRDPIAIFSPDMAAWIDDEGQLSIGNAHQGARIGEPVVHAAAPDVTEPGLVAAVRRACGDGPLLWVNDPKSAYAAALVRAGWDAPLAAKANGVAVEVARQKMLAALRGAEAARRACAEAGRSCAAAPAPAPDRWLMPPPPAPPPAPR